MTDITIKEGKSLADAETVLVQPAAPEGWIAWHRWAGCGWCVTYPLPDAARDYNRHPTPLHPTREEALKAARNALPNGGEVRLVRVTL